MNIDFKYYLSPTFPYLDKDKNLNWDNYDYTISLSGEWDLIHWIIYYNNLVKIINILKSMEDLFSFPFYFDEKNTVITNELLSLFITHKRKFLRRLYKLNILDLDLYEHLSLKENSYKEIDTDDYYTSYIWYNNKVHTFKLRLKDEG